MAIALVASQTYGFADGNAGHACVFTAGAPATNDLDVLAVNSNTVVSTPSGFTLRVDATSSQGAYIYTRKAAGGETDTVTVTTSGDHNTTVTWSRWSGTDAYSAGGFTRADNSNNTILPATSTGTLAATGMLVLAFGALHNHDGALAASPSWSNSFTDLQSISQGTAASSSSVVGFTGYKLGVGTASETIDSVSWTNNTRNRYALWISVTEAAGGATDLTSADATHAQTAESPTLTQDHQLAAADASHGQTAEQPALTQVHVIVAQDAAHGHAADEPALTQTHALGVDDAIHGHTADQSAVTQAHVLLVADAGHAHTAEQPTLSQVHALTTADALHGHLADSPALTQLHALVVADATHAQTADQASLAGATDLVVNDASHAHSAENATVTQTHALTAADALHGHLADLATLTQLHQLVAADAHHTHTADNGTVSPPVVPGILRAGFTRPKLTAGRLPRDQ